MYSWLMSRTGYAGIYFALTGEANINRNMPAFMPATIAHELAHQRGVFAEDETNFVAIIACITSGNTVYEYSGYLLGLIYLLNAIFDASRTYSAAGSDAWIEAMDAWIDIQAGFGPELRRDWTDNYEFWASQRTVDTGITIIDTVLTAVTQTVSDAVTAIYDGYLRAQDQELGIRSYGAVVDLLVLYFSTD